MRIFKWLVTSCVCLMTSFLSSATAQDNLVRGVVVDTEGEPIVGAYVVQDGASRGVITDQDGGFSIKASKGDTLTVSYIGYVTRSFSVKNAEGIRVTLVQEVGNLGEVVVVGYSTQEKATLTGAVSTIKSDAIADNPVSNVSQVIAGRVSGVMTQQRSGMPGADDVTIRIRGIGTYNGDSSGALVLVDGIERSMNELDPSEIESLTVLKDASATAVYGIRGANGVILVTTKHGQVGRPTVAYSGNFAMQVPTRFPKLLSSYNLSSLFNEARWNDTQNPTDIFSPAELEKFRNGSDSIMYPDTDWYDYCMDKSASQTKHHIHLTGGTEFVRYYVGLGYFNQDGLQKEFNQKYDYSNKDRLNRLNIRSNICMTVSKTTDLQLNLGVIRSDKFRVPDNHFFELLSRTPSNCSPGIVDEKLILIEGRTDFNPIAQLRTGTTKFSTNELSLSLSLNQDLRFITPGLAFRIKAAYDDRYRHSISRTKAEPTYYAFYTDVNGDKELVFRKHGENAVMGAVSNYFDLRSRKIHAETALTYNRTFNRHSVSALLLGALTKKWFHEHQNPGVPMGYIEGVGRITYNYAYKYLVEINAGYNGSENFPKKSRFGFFPAVSVGWVVSKEPFWRSSIPSATFSHLKVIASYGLVGNDRLGTRRFMYLPGEYVNGNTVHFGDDYVSYQGMHEGKIGNPDITWETVKKLNIGIETRWFKDRLSLDINYFNDKRDDILTPLNTIPSHVALGQSDGFNIGRTENHGVEVEAGWKATAGNLNYGIHGNYTFARNRVLEMDEIMDKNNPQLWRTGRRIGELFGYVFDGFFNSQEEIDRSPEQFGIDLHPGDVRYVDVNGDGVVNTNDQVPLAHPTFPEMTYGINLDLQYRNIDFSVLFQGVGNVSLILGGNFQKPFAIKGNIYEHSVDRWHYVDPEHTIPYENAKYPRLTTNYSVNNNYERSSLWIKDASYMRLKNIVIGYTFRGRKLQKASISKLRINLNAQNLLTFSDMKIVDPESYASSGMTYPNLKVINFGVNIDF